MDTIYFNVIKDIEGIFGDYVVIFSSHKTCLESNFRESKIQTIVGKSLERETDNIYSIAEGNSKEEIEALLIKSLFVKSEALTIFEEGEEDSEENTVESTESTETTDVETESSTEVKTEESEEIETVEPILPAGTTVTIKDWRDLKSIQLIYSYLQNYKRIMGPKYDSMLFSNDIRYENKVLYDLLISNNILTESERDFLARAYPEAIYTLGHKRKPGSIDNPTDVCIFLNPSILMTADAVSEASVIYSKNFDYFDNIYFYWESLYAGTSMKETKALVKGTLSNVTAALGATAVDRLFEFCVVDIDDKVKNPKKVNKSKMTEVEDEGESTSNYICGILTVNNYEKVGPVKLLKDSRKILVVEDAEYFSENKSVQDPESFKVTDKIVLETLRIRGIDTLNNPHFLIPSHFELTLKNVLRLISGINGLVFDEEFNNFLNSTEESSAETKGTTSGIITGKNEEELLTGVVTKVEELIQSPDFEEVKLDEEEPVTTPEKEPIVIIVNEDESLIVGNILEAEIMSKEDLAQMIYDDADKAPLNNFEGEETSEEEFLDYLMTGNGKNFTDCAVITAVQKNLFNYGKVEEDLKKYNFGFDSFACGKLDATTSGVDNLNKILGINITSKGIPYLTACAYDDKNNESPVVFAIYFDGTDLRAYVPSCGNAINLDTNSAFGRDKKSDIAYCKMQGLTYDGLVDINSELILKDIDESLYEAI